MMKRINLTLFALLLMGSLLWFTSCSNDNEGQASTAISAKDLPSESSSFINTFFADYSITNAWSTVNGYSVSLAKGVKSSSSGDGYEIDFDLTGEWDEITGNDDMVLPVNILALIPRDIVSYVTQNYPLRGINEIKKESYGYKIELAGDPDVELMFDIDGIYLGEDNDNEIPVSYEQLPASSKTFLSTYFAGSTPSSIVKEGDSYEVKYPTRTTVKFNILGDWSYLYSYGGISSTTVKALLPATITNYLSSNYSSSKVESLTSGSSVYVVKLYMSVRLIFDKDGNLWGSSGSNNAANVQKYLTFSQLPQSVQQYLTNNLLSGTTFLYAEKDDNEYEVRLSNGTKVELTPSGELINIEVIPGNKVPDNLILPAILNYVKANYSNKAIEEYEKKAFGYKVELSGYPTIELIFDLSGNFKQLD